MRSLRTSWALASAAVALIALAALAEEPKTSSVKIIPAGSKVFIAAMDDGFDKYLKDALAAKKVPLDVVSERDKADYEITGHSETHKAGAAKKIIFGSWHSDEQASIAIANLKTGEVVFAYSANKQNSAHGKRSTAEACAKHLKEQVK